MTTKIFQKTGVILFLVLFFLALSYPAKSELVAVSQMGYHPQSYKQVISYTSAASGAFDIMDKASSRSVAHYSLTKPEDAAGNQVTCQGGQQCLVGDFSGFRQPGTYYILTGSGGKSPVFSISPSIFKDNVPVILEFFNAMMQQNSAYHKDLHSGYNPQFAAMADGSFIMEADQAALPLIRLGSAYRRDPSLFSLDKYTISASNKPDMLEYMRSLVMYLEGLQGLSITQRTDGVGFRLSPSVHVSNVFVPGPTNITSMDVYIPGNPPQLLTNAPVVSMCGADDGSASWQKCISDAEAFYKCQADEPCLNMTYIEKTGTVASSGNGYGVSRGWGFEFGCYPDINLKSPGFIGKPDPCMIFYPDANRQYTSMALLGFLEAYPGMKDYSSASGQEVLTRSINTYSYIKANYPAYQAGDNDAGFFGAAAFLLYDYTGDSSYLNDAYNMRSLISTTISSDVTHGNEFYWEEYARHKPEITAAGLAYQFGGADPASFFESKISNDYSGRGSMSMDMNGEHVYMLDNNIQFQNSRYILMEGLLADKAIMLNPGVASSDPVIADNQLSWMTGMNSVQSGVAIGSPMDSFSFIIGIGSNFPSVFHSRLLSDTGYSAASSGVVIGARGTDLQFRDPSTGQFVYFDGVANILGYKLGAMGNGWRNETQIDPLKPGQAFANGMKYIPGWINGAYVSKSIPGNTVFNYKDNINTYEFTETTNEIAATALEFMAYSDVRLSSLNSSNSSGNTSGPIPPTLPVANGSVNITTVPPLADVSLNNNDVGMSDQNGAFFLPNLSPGQYTLTVSKSGYNPYGSAFAIQEGQNLSLSVHLTQGNVSQNATGNTTLPGAKIVSAKTSLGQALNTSGVDYSMFETGNASFSVKLDTNDTITWSIDDKEVRKTYASQDSMAWSPGILYTDKDKVAVVTVRTSTDTYSWLIDVQNVINPFFSSVDEGPDKTGSTDAIIHVFTNSNAVVFDNVTATIVNGKSTARYPLAIGYSGNGETDWKTTVSNLAPGNNYLREITGIAGNRSVTYSLGNERVHYTNGAGQGSGGPSGGSSGGSSRATRDSLIGTPVLVNAIFQSGLLSLNDTQNISVDAKNFGGGVRKVQAVILTPSGSNRTIDLSLTKGSHEYGTWTGEVAGLEKGLYRLSHVDLWSLIGPTGFDINDTTFYVKGNDIASNLGNLTIVYAVLDPSIVDDGTTVNLKMDAADSKGITSAGAHVASTRGEVFDIQMNLTKGNGQYGTWIGSFVAKTPDTTYDVKTITLSNAQDTKTYNITGRSVYVNYVPPTLETEKPGQAAKKLTFSDLIQNPLVPTAIGFAIMVVIGTIALLFTRRE